MSFYTSFKNMDNRTIDVSSSSSEGFGIHNMDTVDVLQYSMQRNVLVGTASATITPPTGYTLTGVSAERQALFVAVVGTCKLTVVHLDTTNSQQVTDVFSLFGNHDWPCILEASFANIISATIQGDGATADSNEFVAYWSVEVEPTDVRL